MKKILIAAIIFGFLEISNAQPKFKNSNDAIEFYLDCGFAYTLNRGHIADSEAQYASSVLSSAWFKTSNIIAQRRYNLTESYVANLLESRKYYWKEWLKSQNGNSIEAIGKKLRQSHLNSCDNALNADSELKRFFQIAGEDVVRGKK